MPLGRRELLLLLGSGAVVTATSSAQSALAAPRRPIVGSLRDRVGVNAHWDYPDTPYGAQYPALRKLLVDSGIRHVRGQLTRAGDLARSGIYTTLLADLDADGKGTPLSVFRAAKPLIESGAIVAIEGPNEPDVIWARSNWSYQGAGFPHGPGKWQRDLYSIVKSSAATRHVPVIGMSFGVTYWDGGHPFAPGSLESVVDWGNFHPYSAGNPFAHHHRYGGIDDYMDNADFPSVTLDKVPINFSTYRPPFGKKPMVATETGYPTWRLGQSEKVQGWYTPRIVLEHARLGVRRTYLYELVDQKNDTTTDREYNWGLLRNDLSPKPAYRALRSLLSVVGDGIPAVKSRTTVAGLTYSIAVKAPKGYDPAQLHHLAFELPDGSAVIALWHEVSADDLSPLHQADPQPMKFVHQPAMDVTVKVLSRRHPATHRPSAARIDDAGKLAPLTISRTTTSARLPVDGRVTLLSL